MLPFFNNFEFKLHRKKDHEGQILALNLDVDKNRIAIINSYGLNDDSQDFMNKVRTIWLNLIMITILSVETFI